MVKIQDEKGEKSMKTKHFAKVWEFDIEGEAVQLLIFAEPDDDTKQTVIHQIVNFEVAQMDATIRTKIDMDAACQKITEMPESVAKGVAHGCVNAMRDILAQAGVDAENLQ